MTTAAKRMRDVAMALAVTVALLGACGGADEPALDDEGDAFLSGKGDTAGIVDGTLEAAAVLRLASNASEQELAGAIGLHALAAEAIVVERAARGTDFTTLAELDAVPYVGPVAFYQLLKHVVAQGLTGDPSRISGPGEPLRIADREYLLVDEQLLAQRETVLFPGEITTTVDWALHVKAEYLAYDAEHERIVAFGAHNLYLVNRYGVIEAVYDEGYAEIPNLRVDLLAGAKICVVYQNLAGYYQGKSLGAYMVGNFWAGAIYQWWHGYFAALCNLIC